MQTAAALRVYTNTYIDTIYVNLYMFFLYSRYVVLCFIHLYVHTSGNIFFYVARSIFLILFDIMFLGF